MVGDIIDQIQRGRNRCVMDQDLKVYHLGRIQPLIDKVDQLVTTGHQIELKKGVFPVDAAETEDTKAILWRHMAEEGQPEDDWKLLILEKELKGDAGPEGPEGEPGKGLNVHGTVNTQNALTLPGSYAELGISTPVVGTVMVVNGVDEGWIYKGVHNPSNPDTGWQHIDNWNNLGKIAGISGPRGPRGPQGPKGSSGGIGAFLFNWLSSTITNTAVTAAMMAANDAVEEALNAAISEFESIVTSTVESTVEKAIDDLGDLTGEKGEKGEDGKDGKDGKSFEVVGHYDLLSTFMTRWPAIEANVGKAAVIGIAGEPHADDGLWAITKSALGHCTHENMGDIKGPKGDDATWTIQLRNKANSAVGNPIVVEPTDKDGVVPNLYIQGTNGVKVERFQSSETGFVIKCEFPIPEVNPQTGNFFLSNDGRNTEWVDFRGEMENWEHDRIKLRSPSGRVYALTVGDDGRLNVEEVVR